MASMLCLSINLFLPTSLNSDCPTAVFKLNAYPDSFAMVFIDHARDQSFSITMSCNHESTSLNMGHLLRPLLLLPGCSFVWCHHIPHALAMPLRTLQSPLCFFQSSFWHSYVINHRQHIRNTTSHPLTYKQETGQQRGKDEDSLCHNTSQQHKQYNSSTSHPPQLPSHTQHKPSTTSRHPPSPSPPTPQSAPTRRGYTSPPSPSPPAP